jgi:hypothetical protein
MTLISTAIPRSRVMTEMHAFKKKWKNLERSDIPVSTIYLPAVSLFLRIWNASPFCAHDRMIRSLCIAIFCSLIDLRLKRNIITVLTLLIKFSREFDDYNFMFSSTLNFTTFLNR